MATRLASGHLAANQSLSMQAQPEILASRSNGSSHLINAFQCADRQVGRLPIRRIQAGRGFYGIIGRALRPAKVQGSVLLIDGQLWRDGQHGYILGHVPMENWTDG